MKSIRPQRTKLKRLIAWVLIASGPLLVLFDVLTNKINGLWSLLFFIPLFGLILLFGWKETVIAFGVVLVGVLIWVYLEFLQEHLSGQRIDRFSTLSGRFITAIISFSLYYLFRWVFYESVKGFFRNLWEMISYPPILKALAQLIVSYLVVTAIFGMLYASVYIFIGPSTFQSDRSLQLMDFMYYSVFIPTTLGYPDILPKHWLARALTLLEIGFGILVIVVYLGAIVGIISEYVSQGRTPLNRG